MLTIDKLKEFGADTEEGLGRCFGNEALYLRLAAMIPGQAEFAKLDNCIGENDLKGAFEAAHALKGVLGNLSITPIYTKVSEITELLRAETDCDYVPLVKEIIELKDRYAALCD